MENGLHEHKYLDLKEAYLEIKTYLSKLLRYDHVLQSPAAACEAKR